MYHTTVTQTGVTIVCRTPHRQAEVVRLDLALLYDDVEAVRQLVCGWVQSHDAVGEDGVLMSTLDVLDHAMSPHDLLMMAVSLCEATRPPRLHLEAVTALSTIIHAGGCSCRICQGRIKGRDPRPHELMLCKYNGTPDHAYRLYRLTAPHTQANLLHEHPSLTAIFTAIRLGESQAVQERQQARDRKSNINSLLGI